ncbi:MAG: hypothetical protein ACLFPL_02465 [Candidatus Nanoarchaeia archaeon]
MNLKIVELLVLMLIFQSLFSLSFADTNGVWTYSEDIRAGVFGADEGNPTGSNYTFNDMVYFNQNLVYKTQLIEDIFVNTSGDTMSGNLDMGGNIISNINRLITNPSTSDYLGGVFAEYYFTRGAGTSYYLRPAGSSNINNLDVIGSLELNGVDINDIFVNEGQSNSISNTMLQDNSVTGDKIANNAITINEIDTSSLDNQYVNRAGDTMSGNLDMGGNDITNIGNIESSQYCDENGNNCVETGNIRTDSNFVEVYNSAASTLGLPSTPEITVNGGLDKWPDFFLCRNSDSGQGVLIMEVYDFRLNSNVIQYKGNSNSDNYFFYPDGSYRSGAGGDSVQRGCGLGSSNDDIVSICDAGLCG